MALVTQMAERVLGDVLLVHSTSWRYEAGSVVLSFATVIEGDAVGDMPALPVGRVDLARGAATAAPDAIGHQQVLEHALRHLAWLAEDDEAVHATLDPGWHTLLKDYVPAPFQQLG